MQILRNTSKPFMAQFASGMSAFADLTGTIASGFNGPGNGAGMRLALGPSGMQCSGGPVSKPGDDV